MRVATMRMRAVLPALAFCPDAIRRRSQKALPSPSRWMASASASAMRGSDSDDAATTPAPTSTSTMMAAAETTAAASPLLPRAAVSTVVQCRIHSVDATNGYQYYYLLVQRGREPNLGLWSLPGGKLEWGESTLEGARRELDEETIWPAADSDNAAGLTSSLLRWYGGTLCATDSIGNGYHYVIAQCFAQLTIPGGGYEDVGPPRLEAADDAAAVGWFTRKDMQDEGMLAWMTPGVVNVIDRAEELSAKGLLPVN